MDLGNLHWSETTQNERGEWVPSIPVPYYLWFGCCQCNCCGRRFRNEERYRGHYALVHVLALASGR